VRVEILERKFFKNNHLKVGILLGWELELAFRVLFSAIFLGLSLGSFHQVETCGSGRKKKFGPNKGEVRVYTKDEETSLVALVLYIY
jgi:hypothetical protein